MALQNHLRNNRGQILVESVFLIIIFLIVLFVFQQLIEFKKTKRTYRFSQKEIKIENFKLSTKFAK